MSWVIFKKNRNLIMGAGVVGKAECKIRMEKNFFFYASLFLFRPCIFN